MKYNILVIEESNHALRDRIISVLTGEGFDVATAASSQEVVSTLDEFQPQLIILGEGLPIDSFEACYQLRQAVDTPIMMVGAVPSDQAWARIVETGADFYLEKPFGYLELAARVRAETILPLKAWLLSSITRMLYFIIHSQGGLKRLKSFLLLSS